MVWPSLHVDETSFSREVFDETFSVQPRKSLSRGSNDRWPNGGWEEAELKAFATLLNSIPIPPAIVQPCNLDPHESNS
jgi:hypothetical protein